MRKTEGWKIKEGQHGKEAVVLGRDQGTILHKVPSADSDRGGINLIGGTLCSALKLPLFLDVIGTIVVACLSGPWVAALTGLLTNLSLALVANPVYLPYAAVSVLCGLVVGYMV